MQIAAANLMIALRGDLDLTAEDRRNLKHSAVGGVILFARNFCDASQLRRLTADIRRAAQRRILIAADQEGGRVQRFCGGGFSPLPPAAALRTKQAARDAGLTMAAELRAAGLDLSFAPVLDLAHGKSAIIGDRAFARTGGAAAARALAFAAGMRAAGIACCGKHFPGHGFVRADSHQTLPRDEREFSEIAAADLVPFSEWAKAKMSALMTAHIVFPKCDKTAATFSRFWLRDILRGRLQFGGMIIGDDLTMEGAVVNSGGDGENGDNICDRMDAALSAGCEGLLICKPEAVRRALSQTKAKKDAENPWQKLAPAADGIITIGDKEYEEARARLLQ